MVCLLYAAYRPCVKDHNSIVLRAENVGIKYEWITRMMRAMAASAGPPPPPPATVTVQQQQPAPAAAGDQRLSKGMVYVPSNTSIVCIRVSDLDAAMLVSLVAFWLVGST